jgi:hypothetical protein
MAREKGTRLRLLGERVGAPFSAWRINRDYTVTGVTLYTCNDKAAHVTAKQAYTARGSWVFPDTNVGDYFTDQTRALETACNRAANASRAAYDVYIAASHEARNAREALNKHKAEQ